MQSMQITNLMPYETFDSNKVYLMDPDNKLVDIRNGGRFNQSIILKYMDGTEWVFINNKPIERFCGFLYLQKALNESNISIIKAAENKIAIHERKIIYLSRYYGDKKPDFMELIDFSNELSILNKEVKFTDTAGNANLRNNDGIIYVFDTEKNSFDKSIHEKIDSFILQHDIIRRIAEESLEK